MPKDRRCCGPKMRSRPKLAKTRVTVGVTILQKLKQGQDITPHEAELLAEELHNEHPHITIDLLRKVYNHRKAELVQFIKHILGIEVLETFEKSEAP